MQHAEGNASSHQRHAILLAFLFSGLVWIYATRAQDPALLVPPGQRPPSPQVEFPAPNFGLPTRDGKTFNLTTTRGKPVVLNFWATWCPPCRAEMPDLQRVAKNYAAQDVQIIGINQAENQEQVNRFLQETGLDFPIALDSDASVSQLYRVRSLPTTFFIDRNGVIREIVVGGPMSEALLASKIEGVLP